MKDVDGICQTTENRWILDFDDLGVSAPESTNQLLIHHANSDLA